MVSKETEHKRFLKKFQIWKQTSDSMPNLKPLISIKTIRFKEKDLYLGVGCTLYEKEDKVELFDLLDLCILPSYSQISKRFLLKGWWEPKREENQHPFFSSDKREDEQGRKG